MKFEYAISIDQEFDTVWTKLQDQPAVIRCIPGVERVELSAAAEYVVAIKTRVGPVSLNFVGQAASSILNDHYTVVSTISMTDRRTGNIYGQFAMALSRAADGVGAALTVQADVVIGGKVGELAQPLIRRKADQIVQQFSRNVAHYFAL